MHVYFACTIADNPIKYCMLALSVVALLVCSSVTEGWPVQRTM